MTVDFDLETLQRAEAYRLLVSLVVPRPIALVTTINNDGLVNAAPFSFFNLLGSDPPIVALGIGRDELRPLGLKDTAFNILQNGEFVINLVNDPIAKAMNICGTEFPPNISEVEMAKLLLLPSAKLTVPRIAESPAQLECRHHSTIEIGRTRITLGVVVHLHVAEQFYEATTKRIHTDKIGMIGRMHGRGFYTKTTELFEIPRIPFSAWQQSSEEK
ncbi:MAG: flavin reductase family protein [Acidobacteria bacterium]|nr:flavin reductase family protein [Acidobacteriota bacterium]